MRDWELRLLGPIELVRHGEPVDIGPPQRRQILAALAVDAGRPVPIDTLVERVWGPSAPQQTRRTLQAQLARIRQVAGTASLVRRSGGYQLDVPPETVDIGRFHTLMAQARYPEAVELFRGEPLAGLQGHWVDQTRESWRQRLLDAVIAWARAEKNEQVLGRLAALVDEHPLVEPLGAAYLLALHAAGRTAEALDFFARTRDRLIEQLGIEPGAELRGAHLELLGEETPAGAIKQLPHDVAGFAGREAQLKTLDELLDRDRTPVVATIAGTAGVGKTALAVHWAHQVRDQFPDGQLYVNLAGFDPAGAVVTAAEAVRGFLVALGVEAHRVPSTPAEQTALYRSLLADRQVLILLDNARNAEHARPLLPGTARSLAIVTSRDSLGGLIAEGAYPMRLDVLTESESGDLLDRRIGRRRIAAEPQAVSAITVSCAGLPLALAVVAVRAATNPSFTMAALAEELRDSRLALDALSGGDPASDVRVVLSWSYNALEPAAARLFRLLGLYGGPDVSVAVAASLIGEPVRRTRLLLADLARAHLLAEHRPGRYGMHDLLRAYAAELAETTDPAADRSAALRRVFDHFVHTGKAAALQLFPRRVPMEPDPPLPGAVVLPVESYPQAEEWFAAEHRALISAIRRTQELGLDRITGRLGWTMTTFLLRRGHWHDWVTVERAALAAAQRLGDRSAEAMARRSLARALHFLGHIDESETECRRALDLFHELGDAGGEATTHDNLTSVLADQRRFADAVAHSRAALRLFTSINRVDGMASAANSLACSLVDAGEPAAAVEYAEQSLTLHRDIGDRDGEAATWDTLGLVRHELGEWSAAAAGYRQALILYRELGDRFKIAETLRNQGVTQRAAGDLPGAGESWREALALFETLGHREAETVRKQLATLGEQRRAASEKDS